MDTFTIHADFNQIDGTPSKTKWVRIVTSAQVVGPDGEIFDDADIPVTGGVLDVQVPANTNKPTDGFTYTILRERGKTKLWRIQAQAPSTTAELADYTESLPLVIPLNQQGATQADLLAHLTALDPHGDRAYTDDGVAFAMSAATSLIAGHLAATDPHGDRAYTDAQISAAVNSLIDSAPGTLNTLGEIATALAEDDSAAAALTTLVNAKASQAALDAEATARADADTALDGRVDTLESAVPSYDDLTDKPTIPNSPDDIGAEALGVAASLVTAHLAAADPHGDRAYTNAQISAAVNSLIDSAPGTLNTLGEIATALAEDDTAVAALTTVVNAKASQAALDAEATARATGDTSTLASAAVDATTKANNAAAASIPLSQKNVASGVAPLDAGVKVPDANLPNRLGYPYTATNTNADLLVQPGFYSLSNAATNTPEAGHYYDVWVSSYSYVNWAAQLASDLFDNKLWYRSQNNSVWSSWRRIDSPPTYFEVSTMRGIPGCMEVSTALLTYVTGYNYYYPLATDEYVTISEARCEVTAASAAGTKASFALYRADKAGQPLNGGLVRDWGETPTDTTGVKVLAGADLLLAPGRYVIVGRSSGGPTFRTVGYNSDKFQSVLNTMGANPFRTSTFVATAYAAAAPTNPPQWNNANYSATAGWLSPIVLAYTVAA